MIERHPEWDGFRLDPFKAFVEPRSPHECDGATYLRLKEAWLRQTGPAQPNGMVLHNAAMFFAVREPKLAADLLKRAIALQPAEELYVERLGVVYALAQGRTDHLGKYGVVTGPERIVFARQARAILLSSDNWLLVRGGASSLSRCSCNVDNFSKELLAKANTLSDKKTNWDLPSWSGRYVVNDCYGYGSHLIGNRATQR